MDKQYDKRFEVLFGCIWTSRDNLPAPEGASLFPGDSPEHCFQFFVESDTVLWWDEYNMTMWTAVDPNGATLPYNMLMAFSDYESDISDASNGIGTNTVEYKIWLLMQKDKHATADLNYIVENLPNIDFNQYNKIDGSAIDLLSWFNSIDFSENDKLDILLKMHGMDGAVAETYAAIVGEMFLHDKLLFISFFNDKQMDNQTQLMISYISYYCSYFDISEILHDLSVIEQNEDLNKNESEFIDVLVIALEKKL